MGANVGVLCGIWMGHLEGVGDLVERKALRKAYCPNECIYL